MPEAIDIEMLCRWAYRDELSKRQTSSAEAVWGTIADWSATGAAIDRGGPQRYDLGSPDPDALALEQMVARLPDHELDWQGEAVDILGDLLALVLPIPEKISPVTGRVATAGWRTPSGRRVTYRMPPPRHVTRTRTLRPAALVTAHAAMGTRPDWHPEPPQPQPVPSVRGHGPKIFGECKGRNYYTLGSCCPLAWEPSAVFIAELRADYLAWWRALGRLARLLAGQLRRFDPQPPAAPQMPWKNLTAGGKSLTG